MASLKDISAICQVSVTTVSKALNGRSDVGKETRERILRTARDLNYNPRGEGEEVQEPHRCTMNLGVLMSPITGHTDEDILYGDSGLNSDQQELGIIRGFCETVMQEGYDILLLNVDDAAKHQMSYLARCKYRKLDGVFIVREGAAVFEERVMDLARDRIPLVTLEQVRRELRRSALKDDPFVLGRTAAKSLIAAVKHPGHMADSTPDR